MTIPTTLEADASSPWPGVPLEHVLASAVPPEGTSVPAGPLRVFTALRKHHEQLQGAVERAAPLLGAIRADRKLTDEGKREQAAAVLAAVSKQELLDPLDPPVLREGREELARLHASLRQGATATAAKMAAGSAAEIRAFLLTLPPEKRRERLDAAIYTRDATALFAMTSAPAVMQILSEDEQALATQALVELHGDPELHQAAVMLERMVGAAEVARSYGQTFLREQGFGR